MDGRTLTLVSPEIDAYAIQHTTPLPSLLQELTQVTHEKLGSRATMISGHLEGSLLQMLIRALGARRVLEFGTFTGFSALMMARALPDDGELVTLDVNPETTAMAQGFWDRSPDGHKIKSVLGPAHDTARTLSGPFDLVFIDADKPAYPVYYEDSLALLSSRGLIVVDNVIRSGRVLNPQSDDDRAVDSFNRMVQDDSRVVNVLLPLRDGITVIRRR
jgi:caffeoyl-CoA O-methyltransferase